MTEYVLEYGIAPSEFFGLTIAQKQAFRHTAERIKTRMKG